MQRRNGPSTSTHSNKGAEGFSIPKTWRIVVGHHAMSEAFIVQPQGLRELWLRQGWESTKELRDFEKSARERKIKITVKPPQFLDRVCATNQGAALLKEGRIAPKATEDLEKATVLILDGIEDPHNLGAILRTAWLMNVQGVLIPEERAVGLSPTVHKVACGGVEHVPVETLSNFKTSIEELKKQGFWVFGLSHKAKKTVFDMKIPEKIVWAIGSEDKGLRSTTERLCDELVSIPQVAAAASYNASVATAIALTETHRQHDLLKR